MRSLGLGSQTRQQMRMRARILRQSETNTDTWGGPAAGREPDVIYDALPCLAWQPTDNREVLDGGDAVFGSVRLAVSAEADINEKDLIESIVDRIGRVIFEGPLRITAVTRRGNCLAVMARLQRGGRV